MLIYTPVTQLQILTSVLVWQMYKYHSSAWITVHISCHHNEEPDEDVCLILIWNGALCHVDIFHFWFSTSHKEVFRCVLSARLLLAVTHYGSKIATSVLFSGHLWQQGQCKLNLGFCTNNPLLYIELCKKTDVLYLKIVDWRVWKGGQVQSKERMKQTRFSLISHIFFFKSVLHILDGVLCR